MGLISSSTNFSEISKSHYLFSSYNYFSLRKVIDADSSFLRIRISDYFEIISGFAFSSKDYTDEGVLVCRIGDISKTGVLLTDKMLNLPEEYYEAYEKYQIKENDILIGMTGDGKFFKTCFVNKLDFPILLNQRVGILRLKKGVNDDFEAKFLALLFQLEKVQNQIRIVAMGKTQKNVSPFDILNVKIPYVDIKRQREILDLIRPIEDEMNNLKSTKSSHSEIINEVFSSHFSINIEELLSIENSKKFKVNSKSIVVHNSNMRNSFRWNKMQFIQKYLYKDIDCIERLGKFIISTNNGWSPDSVHGGEGIPVLGQEHFRIDGRLDISPTKTTEEIKNNIENFFVKQGDFFVSRGNTVDLVGIASIVDTEVKEDVIYPDLYIRMNFDENVINKNYLAFLFNSFLGRLYFKFVSKGKNQTMVKISSSELLNYYLPIPEINSQKEIVKKIKTQINSQNEIDKKIDDKQNKISKLIEEAIKSSE
ncbi:restriction endonuclease subunit S [Peribacillus sp. JNUCC 23]